jgi:energy-converting hydrogenase B subunit D
MTVVQVVALLVVAVGGGAVALVRDPLRLTLVLGVFGLGLTFLFFAFQAPDVALSEIVVGTIGLPLIILATLRKLADQERARSRDEEDRG